MYDHKPHLISFFIRNIEINNHENWLYHIISNPYPNKVLSQKFNYQVFVQIFCKVLLLLNLMQMYGSIRPCFFSSKISYYTHRNYHVKYLPCYYHRRATQEIGLINCRHVPLIHFQIISECSCNVKNDRY